MTDKQLENTPRTNPAPEGAPGLLKATVDLEVLAEVREAFDDFGFPTLADGIRLISKAFARDVDVRQAVRTALPVAYPDSRVRSEER